MIEVPIKMCQKMSTADDQKVLGIFKGWKKSHLQNMKILLLILKAYKETKNGTKSLLFLKMWECVMKWKWGQLKTKGFFTQCISTVWKQEGVDVKRLKENRLSMCLVLIIDFKYSRGSTKAHASKLIQFWSWRFGWDIYIYLRCIFKNGNINLCSPFL